MELVLALETDDGPLDVRVVADPGHTVSDLVTALGQHLRVPSAIALWRDGEPEPLEADASLSEVGLISGERVGLISGDRFGLAQVFRSRGTESGLSVTQYGAEHVDRPRLAVISGYAAGRSIPVGSVRRVVGRSQECDFTVDDPQMSRRQFSIVANADGSVEIRPDPDSSNAVRLNGTPVREAFRLDSNDTVAAGQTSFNLRQPKPGDQPREFHSFGAIPFSRTPYFRRPILSTSFEKIEVPSKPSRRRFNYISTLAPLFLGVGMALAFANNRFLLFACMSPVIGIANYIDQRWISGKEHRQAVQRFEELVDIRRREIETALERERVSRNLNAPDIGSLSERAQGRLKDLWVRGRGVKDFLRLRIGIGDVVPRLDVPDIGEGDTELVERLAAAQRGAGLLTDVPLVVDAVELGTVGLIGETGSVKCPRGGHAVAGGMPPQSGGPRGGGSCRTRARAARLVEVATPHSLVEFATGSWPPGDDPESGHRTPPRVGRDCRGADRREGRGS